MDNIIRVFTTSKGVVGAAATHPAILPHTASSTVKMDISKKNHEKKGNQKRKRKEKQKKKEKKQREEKRENK